MWNNKAPWAYLDAAGVASLARSVSEGDHETIVRPIDRAKRAKEANSRCHCYSEARGPSWSPSLTLFEVALFAVCRGLLDIEFFPSPKRQRGTQAKQTPQAYSFLNATT